MSGIIGAIKGVLSGKGTDLIKSVGGIVDNLTLSKEEKEKLRIELIKSTNEHIEKMEVEATKRLEIDLKEMESARNREIQLATSEHTPMLSKIITPLLALIIVLCTIIIWSLILFRNYEPKVNEAMIIGSLTTMSASVLAYYFGSSTGSKSKQGIIEKMRKSA